MRTKHLIIALLVIVAIFIGKGMYVTNEVRITTNKSYQQFELFQNVIHPLIDSYSIDVVDETMKVTHAASEAKSFVERLEIAQVRQKSLMDRYIAEVQGTETMDDKELYMRVKEASAYIEKLKRTAKAGEEYNVAELYGVFDPLQKCLHRIAGNRLKMAEDYKTAVENSLKRFDHLMLLACVLIAILAVAAARYKEVTPCICPKYKKRKNTISKKTKK